MGLDMYLYLRKSVYTSEYSNPENCVYPNELQEFVKEIQERSFKAIETNTDYHVGYWRKANAIHNWIVENCTEDGEDNCRPIYMDENKVKELIDICDQVLKDHNKAKELLPTQSGFFFGCVDYDEWYFKDVEYTKHIFERVLEVYKKFYEENNNYNINYDIIYQASW